MALRRSHLIYVDPGPEWRTVQAALQRNSRDAPRELDDALDDSLGPIVSKVRREALAIPARGLKHTGLRGRLAAGVEPQTAGKGARIVATAQLSREMDNGPRGWRHPVYGNRDVWVHQRGFSWFREPIAEEGDAIERQLTDVLEDMAENIANAGRATGRI